MSGGRVSLLHGDACAQLAQLDAGVAQTCVTSPPYYGLRDYGEPGQYGLEPSPAEYVAQMVKVFREVARVLAPDGTLWLNLGDSYSMKADASAASSYRRDDAECMPGRINTTAFLPRKNLLMIPARVAIALQDDGWILRNEVIWRKLNAMPSSVTDRLSNRTERLYLFARQERYLFNLDAIRQPYSGGTLARYEYDFKPDTNPASHTNHLADGGTVEANPLGKNPGDVWDISTSPYPGAHFATMPPKLAERCILAGSNEGHTVLDPFVGAGTVTAVAQATGRDGIGIDLSAEYLAMATARKIEPARLVHEGRLF